MESREDLEKRVAQLEKRLSGFQQGTVTSLGLQGIRWRASWGIGNIPLFDIALGPDLERGEFRGHARGIIAIGDMATGFLAIGGLARGVLSVGGLALGVLSVGGLSVGLLGALGGLAIGSVALGGGAIGGVALGGGAAGYYACGGGTAGVHVVSAMEHDPQAEKFFREHGLAEICGGR